MNKLQNLRKIVTEQGYEFYPIMAAIRYGVDPVLKSIEEKLSKLPPVRHFEPEAAPESQLMKLKASRRGYKTR